MPDSELLIKLSEVLDVPVGTLLGEDLQPEQEKSELRKIAEKLENLNAMLAERNARGRTLMKIAAICLIAAASVYAAVELLPLYSWLRPWENPAQTLAVSASSAAPMVRPRFLSRRPTG